MQYRIPNGFELQETSIDYRDLFKGFYDYFNNLSRLTEEPKGNLLLEVLQKDIEDRKTMCSLHDDPLFIRVQSNFESIKRDALETVMNLQYLMVNFYRKRDKPKIESD